MALRASRESKRDRHVDLARAAFLTCGDPLTVSHEARTDFIKPATTTEQWRRRGAYDARSALGGFQFFEPVTNGTGPLKSPFGSMGIQFKPRAPLLDSFNAGFDSRLFIEFRVRTPAILAYSFEQQQRYSGLVMSISPDSEFAKIFELLNGFERPDENEPLQPPPLQAIAPATKHPLRPAAPEPPPPSQRVAPAMKPPPRPDASEPPPIALEAEVENSFAAHIAAAMAKRANP